jgi:hypothetical protein
MIVHEEDASSAGAAGIRVRSHPAPGLSLKRTVFRSLDLPPRSERSFGEQIGAPTDARVELLKSSAGSAAWTHELPPIATRWDERTHRAW